MFTALILAAALGASDPAAPVATPPATPAPAAADANKVICHSEETTGSRLGNVRVCMTKAQWEARSAADRATLESFTNGANATSPH
jgi:hypothetical protein